MRRSRGFGVVLGLVVGSTLGAPVVLSSVDAPVATRALSAFVDEAAAQSCNDDSVCSASESEGGEGGDATARGGNGGNGGLAIVRDIGNARADAANSVIVDDITTGDAHAADVIVDARGASDPVVVSVAGSFPDTGVDVFAPGGSAQAGTTGGNANGADASGGEGGDATARGGTGGDDKSYSPVLGCLDLELDLGLCGIAG